MDLPEMHDWTLETILVDWSESSVRIRVKGPAEKREFHAKEFSELAVPRRREWGPSASINKIHGPEKNQTNAFVLKIEMQTGDTIVLVASAIECLDRR